MLYCNIKKLLGVNTLEEDFRGLRSQNFGSKYQDQHKLSHMLICDLDRGEIHV